MKIKNFSLLLYSLLFIPIWGIMILDPITKSEFSIFVCLLYTFGSNYFIQKNRDDVYSKYRLLIVPFLYVVFTTLEFKISLFLFLNPVVIAFVFLIFGTHVFKDLSKKGVLFFYMFFAYFYTFNLMKYWEISIS